MESRDPDRFFKRLWLVNGVLVLVFTILAIVGLSVIVLPEIFASGGSAVAAAPNAPGEDAAPRAVRFGLPEDIRGSSTQLVRIHYGRDFAQRPTAGIGSASSYDLYEPRSGPLVNVAFLPADGGPARLLFDRPIHIERLSYPSGREDSLQTWISYSVVDGDTDEDGRLEPDDGLTLYLSDLDGTRLRRALPESWRLISHGPSGDGRSLVIIAAPVETATDRRLANEAQHRAFVYDLATGATMPFAALDTAVTRAGLLLARPVG